MHDSVNLIKQHRFKLASVKLKFHPLHFVIHHRYPLVYSLVSILQFYNVHVVLTYCMFNIAGIYFLSPFSGWLHFSSSVSMVH